MEKRQSLARLDLRPSARQVFLHLVERDHTDACLGGSK
jgi:hypothetical protein